MHKETISHMDLNKSDSIAILKSKYTHENAMNMASRETKSKRIEHANDMALLETI